MAAKPETTFYTSVHKHLPPLSQLHREKMANPYRGGTFDHWYDGERDLWVEWKFILVPKRPTTLIDLVTPRGKKQESLLSGLQQEWGRARYDNGRDVWVIVGCAAGGVVFSTPYGDRGWESPLTTEAFTKRLVSRKQIAESITRHTLP